MSELWGHAIGVMILIMMTMFISMWIWVWRARHARLFNRMAQLPQEDPVAPHDQRQGVSS